MILIHVLTYRLDCFALAVLTLGALWFCRKFVRRQRPPGTIQTRDYVIVALLFFAGLIAAEWAGENEKNNIADSFASYARTYAHEFQLLGHAKINPNTPPDDPTYLTLIGRQIDWQQLNPWLADIYTFRGDDHGNIFLIVDSETDYNHDGKIDDPKEARVPIGEAYENPNENFFRALKGETVFDTDFTPDRWGVWASCFTPIYNDKGEVDAALGIDFPAEKWVWGIESHRFTALGMAAFLIAIYLARATRVTLLNAQVKEHMRNEEMLCQAQKNNEIAKRSKNELLAIASHEIRTPISAVRSFVSLLSKANLPELQQQQLNNISNANEQLAISIDDLLEATKNEGSQVVVKRTPFQPTSLLHSVADFFRPQITAHGLTLVVENRLPGQLALIGDPLRIRQIIVNLIDNAIKFTELGTITISADWAPLSSQQNGTGELTIQVRDTGSGIAPDKLAHLFDKPACACSDPQGKTRIGLAICKRLSDLMDARLTILSELNHGTEFTFRLPTREHTLSSTRQSFLAETVKESSARGRALVVDDQTMNRELLRIMLKKLSFEPDLASSGEEALQLFTQQHYAVILMDLDMPVLNGLATTNRIRESEPPGQRIPIIAVTAMASAGIRDRCLLAGMDEYLPKPIFLPALQTVIDKLPHLPSRPR